MKLPRGLDLTDAQREWFESALRFATAALATDMVRRDAEQDFDRELWRRCAEFGLLGLPVPPEYGGLGLGLSEVIAVMEGLGYGSADQGLLFSLNAHLWTNTMPILLFGTEEQKQRYLPGLCDGTLIGANGVSEPDAGSDALSMRTRARREGDGYVLDGTKTFVTNAPVCDLIVGYATLDPNAGPLGITAFIIERDTPGLSVGRKIDKMGLRTSPMGELVFDGCALAAGQRLGREGRGALVFESSMEWERGAILASCVGHMQRQLERCVRYAKQRQQFGQPIARFQAVSHRIVDMKVRIDTCRPLIQRIARLKDAGRSAVTEASIAKLHVSECYVTNGLDAISVFGGYGYTTEQEIERDLRDAIGSRLYSGTSDIQRNLIARSLGLG